METKHFVSIVLTGGVLAWFVFLVVTSVLPPIN
jgi:membrane-associated phospholipid phosphatase